MDVSVFYTRTKQQVEKEHVSGQKTYLRELPTLATECPEMWSRNFHILNRESESQNKIMQGAQEYGNTIL